MFPRYARIRPSRGASLISAVMGVVFLLFAGSMGAPPIFLLFAVVMIGASVFNAIGPGFASEVVEFPPDQPRFGAGGGYCTRCGAGVPAGARFCQGCGQQLM